MSISTIHFLAHSLQMYVLRWLLHQLSCYDIMTDDLRMSRQIVNQFYLFTLQIAFVHFCIPWTIDTVIECAVCPSFLTIRPGNSWTDPSYAIVNPSNWCRRGAMHRNHRATWARQTSRRIWAPNRPAMEYSNPSYYIRHLLLIPNWPGHRDLLLVLHFDFFFQMKI